MMNRISMLLVFLSFAMVIAVAENTVTTSNSPSPTTVQKNYETSFAEGSASVAIVSGGKTDETHFAVGVLVKEPLMNFVTVLVDGEKAEDGTVSGGRAFTDEVIPGRLGSVRTTVPPGRHVVAVYRELGYTNGEPPLFKFSIVDGKVKGLRQQIQIDGPDTDDPTLAINAINRARLQREARAVLAAGQTQD